LEKANSFLPDLIFMDIHLGEKNGIELTKKIKATHPKIHVVILTFYDIPEYREAALQCGSDRFLLKASLSAREIEELIISYQKTLGNVEN
jgi:DNA-binding NarL/FixJ family response regulator